MGYWEDFFGFWVEDGLKMFRVEILRWEGVRSGRIEVFRIGEGVGRRFLLLVWWLGYLLGRS